MAKIIIPTPLRKFTDNQASVETSKTTILDAFEEIAATYPEVKNHLFDKEGQIRSFLRIYVGDEDIKQLNNEQTAIDQQTKVSIIPAIAGG